MLLSDIGHLIRQERRRAGLTAEALAELAGVDRTTLSKLENQRLAELGYSKLERLLSVLGLRLQVVPAGLPTLKELQRNNEVDE
ncbi:helix-turn-helix domain-containing protein [Cellvibrio sp. ARAG 10.3]|uniref:helix-turn-helix domain-containing protein n=1 Tax=Cellvibrio sp. ARAG 10.3 TaxID=3451358 RepID=UPI003F466075